MLASAEFKKPRVAQPEIQTAGCTRIYGAKLTGLRSGNLYATTARRPQMWRPPGGGGVYFSGPGGPGSIHHRGLLFLLVFVALGRFPQAPGLLSNGSRPAAARSDESAARASTRGPQKGLSDSNAIPRGDSESGFLEAWGTLLKPY